MSKNIPTNLLADIRATVTTMATLLEITRQDRRVYRLTNHDVSLTVGGNTYRHDVPFVLSSIQAGSALAIDNTDLSLYCDGVDITIGDFKGGLFDKAEVKISLIDFTKPEDGEVTLRKGWFGQIVLNEKGVANVTVYGLLKALDFEVGRLFQPSCDADLGDNRCKVAISGDRTFAYDTPVRQGDWFYNFDQTLMTEIALVNGDFQFDGSRDIADPITGWSRSPNSSFTVSASARSFPAASGLSLFGGYNNFPTPFEQYITTDVPLTGVMATADIDAGKHSFVLQVTIGQDTYLLDKPRFALQVLNAAGDVIDGYDSGYFTLDEVAAWRTRTVGIPLITGARSVRVFLYMLKTDADIVNTAYDNVRAFFYDHTVGTPYNDVIFNVRRLQTSYPLDKKKRPINASFEAELVANSATTPITQWTRPGVNNYWKVIAGPLAGITGLEPTEGNRMLVGGDSGTTGPITYAIYNYQALSYYGVDLGAVALGNMIGKFTIDLGFANTDVSAGVFIEWLNNASTVVATTTVRAHGAETGAPIKTHVEKVFAVPATATRLRVRLEARSLITSSDAPVSFDSISFYFVNAGRPARNDPIAGFGDADFPLDPTVGSYTWSGDVIAKAHTTHTTFDTVSTVVSHKEFTGTNIDGGDGAYETAAIRWISGANAGQRNLIRVWGSGDKRIKTYFNATNPIQPGDRFLYTRACQKRFIADCVTLFDNAVNFRGFPYLPGKVV